MKDPVIGNADEVEAVAVDFLASGAKVDKLEACGGGLLFFLLRKTISAMISG